MSNFCQQIIKSCRVTHKIHFYNSQQSFQDPWNGTNPEQDLNDTF